MPSYKRLSEESKEFNETNDCTVKAIAVATGVSYERAHNALSMYGRKNRKGANDIQMEQALNFLGYKIERYTWRDLRQFRVDKGLRDAKTKKRRETLKQKGITAFGNYTMKTITEFTKKSNNYIIHVNRHVAAVKNNVVEDWTDNRKHKVNYVWKVVKADA